MISFLFKKKEKVDPIIRLLYVDPLDAKSGYFYRRIADNLFVAGVVGLLFSIGFFLYAIYRNWFSADPEAQAETSAFITLIVFGAFAFFVTLIVLSFILHGVGSLVVWAALQDKEKMGKQEKDAGKGQDLGVSVCQWQTSCEPTEPAGEKLSQTL